MKKAFEILEFNKILEKLEEYAYTEYAKEKFRKLEPILSEIKVISELNLTAEAKKVLEDIGSPPLTAMQDMERLLTIINNGRNANCCRARIYGKYIKSSKKSTKLFKSL